jgi:UDP-2,3-diacylglucosamine pyrophosphatase LpxH
MKYNIPEILAIYQKNGNKTKTAKKYCELNRLKFCDSLRRVIAQIINKNIDSDFEIETKTETIQYKQNEVSLPSAWSIEKNRFYTIEEYCDVYGLEKSKVKSSKLVSHNASHMVYNIAFFTEEEEAVININENLESIIGKFIKPIFLDINPNKINNLDYFDRLVYTDVHIAMDVNGKDGDSLYSGVWDKVEVLRRLNLMILHVLEFQKSNILVIDDLGDFLDGLNGQTTRKGHDLPQNMNDKEAFELALEFKLTLLDTLALHYDEIICNNITNDNHSGLFSYFVSSAFEKIINARYSGRIKVNTIKKFIDHYTMFNHTFVISHGKDIGEQKFGFKPKLDAIQAEKIDQFCKQYKLYNGNFIEFSKGDSHQAIYDDTTSNDFSYYNYPAFSPPSNWVKTNFKNSKSGFNFYNINKTKNIKIAIPYWFA